MFSLLYQLSKWCCPHLLLSMAPAAWHTCCTAPTAGVPWSNWLISPAHRVLSSKPAGHCWWVDQSDWQQTDWQTDARPFHKPCLALHTKQAASITSCYGRLVATRCIARAPLQVWVCPSTTPKQCTFPWGVYLNKWVLKNNCLSLTSKTWFFLYSKVIGNSSITVNLQMETRNRTRSAAVPTFYKTNNSQTCSIRTLSFSLCQASFEYRTLVHCACVWFCGSSGCGSTGLSVDGMLMRSSSTACRISPCETMPKYLQQLICNFQLIPLPLSAGGTVLSIFVSVCLLVRW